MGVEGKILPIGGKSPYVKALWSKGKTWKFSLKKTKKKSG